jgi:hypothetical protein
MVQKPCHANSIKRIVRKTSPPIPQKRYNQNDSDASNLCSWRAVPRKRLAARMGDTRTNCRRARVRTDLAPRRHARFTNERSHINVDTVLRRCAPSAENGLRLNTCLQQATGVEFYGNALLMACEPIGSDYIERRTEVYEDVLSEDLSTLRSSVRSYYDLRRAYAAEFNHPLDGPAPCC